MKKSGGSGLAIYKEKLEKQLEGIVNLVRTNIGKLERLTLEALIVLDVHNKDIISKLIENKVTSPHEFEWLTQMRYYQVDNDLQVRIVYSTLAYKYEYLGNTSRLVRTPLTDRCFMTLSAAMSLNYGGAPQGPAGTGKTETVKCFAKALAR